VPEFVLIDGNRCPPLPPSLAVVKGDSRVAEISAASILAKVTRDAEMAALDLISQYGFAQHKGYPTAFHLEKLLNMAQPSITGAVLAR
jgi:ribonuclease HII